MDIRPLVPGYAVSPQIAPEDVPAIAAQGFTTVICNRPDPEVPHELAAAVLRAAVEAAGLTFVENPMSGGAMTMDHITAQRAAIDAAPGPVLAYCASGNRSSVLWALASAGRQPTEALIQAAGRHGYQLGQFRDLIDRLAQPG